jgi:hypothetical protein
VAHIRLEHEDSARIIVDKIWLERTGQDIEWTRRWVSLISRASLGRSAIAATKSVTRSATWTVQRGMRLCLFSLPSFLLSASIAAGFAGCSSTHAPSSQIDDGARAPLTNPQPSTPASADRVAGLLPQAVQISPSDLPPVGSCRVWFPGRDQKQQPPPGTCDDLANKVPAGAWLISRAADGPQNFRVVVYDTSEPGLQVAVGVFDATTGRLVRELRPQDNNQQSAGSKSTAP